MSRIVFHEAAAGEVRQARAYYAEVSLELGDAFVDELDGVLERVRRLPESGRPWPRDPGRRVFLLSRFPYAVVVRLKPDHLRVLAVAHQHRRPAQARAGHRSARRA